MYLAYNYVGLVVLLAEAHFNAERLNLPVECPIQESQLTFKYIAPPQILRYGGFMGAVHAGQYAFDEGGGRHYRHVAKLDPFGGLSMAERNEALSHQKSQVTTNEAYQLAARWLRAIDVDVPELEKTNKVEVQQRWFWSHDKTATRVLLPIFDVRWGRWDDPKVDVVVDGRTKEFIELRQEDDSFSKRPAELIKNVDQLLAIPDEEFQKYSPLQRSNLVARFAVDKPDPTAVGANR